MSRTPADFHVYRSTATVQAMKICGIDCINDEQGLRWVLWPHNPDFGTITVDKTFMDRCEPELGCYYLVYPDGFTALMAAKVFEAHYA